ncbi:hypothetical protein LguiA_017012 [Lonicera macranthoides]
MWDFIQTHKLELLKFGRFNWLLPQPWRVTQALKWTIIVVEIENGFIDNLGQL